MTKSPIETDGRRFRTSVRRRQSESYPAAAAKKARAAPRPPRPGRRHSTVTRAGPGRPPAPAARAMGSLWGVRRRPRAGTPARRAAPQGACAPAPLRATRARALRERGARLGPRRRRARLGRRPRGGGHGRMEAGPGAGRGAGCFRATLIAPVRPLVRPDRRSAGGARWPPPARVTRLGTPAARCRS